jgi:hypothetical protein
MFRQHMSSQAMPFEILGEIKEIETIATGNYEAHGIGRRDFKIKRIL